MNATTTIGQLLENLESLPDNHGVAFEFSEEISVNSMAYVFAFDDLGDNEDIPQEAFDMGLQSTLTKSEFEDIIYNAKLQKVEVSDGDLLAALNFYILNDAFIQLK